MSISTRWPLVAPGHSNAGPTMSGSLPSVRKETQSFSKRTSQIDALGVQPFHFTCSLSCQTGPVACAFADGAARADPVSINIAVAIEYGFMSRVLLLRN